MPIGTVDIKLDDVNENRLILVIVKKLKFRDVYWTNRQLKFDSILKDALTKLDGYLITYYYDCEWLQGKDSNGVVNFQQTCN